jgi:hypothetical protein
VFGDAGGLVALQRHLARVCGLAACLAGLTGSRSSGKTSVRTTGTVRVSRSPTTATTAAALLDGADALAMITKVTSSAAVACAPINSFALLLSGIVSVGLNALELVNDRYR